VAAGLVSVNGTGLFVDDRGDATAPALLFIHGGPGQSCYDFMQIQGDRLARRLRIIGVVPMPTGAASSRRSQAG
jgi:proline iminopeptidase